MFEDPFERKRIFETIDLLLKLALRNNNQRCLVPPPTPVSTATPSSSSSLKENRSDTLSFNAEIDFFSRQSSSASSNQNFNQIDEILKKARADDIWKQIYDHFEYYNDRAFDQTDLIEKRLTDSAWLIQHLCQRGRIVNTVLELTTRSTAVVK